MTILKVTILLAVKHLRKRFKSLKNLHRRQSRETAHVRSIRQLIRRLLRSQIISTRLFIRLLLLSILVLLVYTSFVHVIKTIAMINHLTLNTSVSTRPIPKLALALDSSPLVRFSVQSRIQELLSDLRVDRWDFSTIIARNAVRHNVPAPMH